MNTTTMNTNEVLASIDAGTPFTYNSKIKKGRVFTITVIKRGSGQIDLFHVKASDLKYPSGTYNTEGIKLIIDRALAGQIQHSKRIA